MSPGDKKRWDEYAKQGSYSKRNKVSEKLTSQGVPISQIDRKQNQALSAEQSMKQAIRDIVTNSHRNGIENEKFIFISVNYFTKTIEGNVYLPAEISLCEYSLKNGVTRKFHNYINPGQNIFGHAFAAKQHTEATHNLPLPPHALGESDTHILYQQILDFVTFGRNRLGDSSFPPVYAHKDQIQATESVLKFLMTGTGCSFSLDVYNIYYLFYTLKIATCAQGGIVKPDSMFITDCYFDRDEYEYSLGIGCSEHEKMDRGKYCTLSCVVRWGFMFSDYMCSDLALDMTPGVHIPKDTNCGLTLSTTKSFIDDLQSYNSDTESFVSFTSGSETTSLGKARKRVTEIDRDSSFAMSSVSGRGYLAKPPKLEEFNEYADQIPENNRWAERNKIQVREPHTETFNFDTCNNANTSLASNRTLDSTCTSIYNRKGRYAAIVAARAVMCIEDEDPLYVNPSSADTSLQSSGRGRLFN
ncbi:MAEL family protein [Megaselia abdita]